MKLPKLTGTTKPREITCFIGLAVVVVVADATVATADAADDDDVGNPPDV